MIRARTSIERILFRALEPIRDHLQDPSVSEILVNGFDGVYFEQAGKLHPSPFKFRDAHELEVLANLVARLNGHVLQSSDYELDGAVSGPPQLRIHVNLGPSSANGISIAIRKIDRQQINLTSLVKKHGAISAQAVDYLEREILEGRNVLISGGTGSGKTALLNALGERIPQDERLIVIEDTRELQFPQDDVVYLVTQKPDLHGEGEVTLRDLFRSALRMRPDRIIIGEVRGPEAFDLIQALGAGHSGSLATIHADTPELALTRLHSLAMLSGVLRSEAVQRQIVQVVSTVVQLKRFRDGSRKVVRVTRVESAGDGQFIAPRVFGSEHETDPDRYNLERIDGHSAVDVPQPPSR